MSRLFGILSVLLVVLLAMGFAAANAGHLTTLDLGLFTLYRIPVTLVAFSGLFVGMLVMFATGIHTDLKVRRILRERLARESEREQTWIDRNQRDLFAEEPAGPAEEPAGPAEKPAGGPGEDESPVAGSELSGPAAASEPSGPAASSEPPDPVAGPETLASPGPKRAAGPPGDEGDPGYETEPERTDPMT